MSNYPKQITIIYRGLLGLSLMHIIIPIIMWLSKSQLANQMKTNSPAMSNAEVVKYTDIVMLASIAFHLIFVVVFFILAKKIVKGINKARIRVTIVLIISAIASYSSFTLSPMFRVLIPLLDLFQIILVILLWTPKSSGSFFSRG